ncbi:unnamed protein product, partial [Adineta steineri]
WLNSKRIDSVPLIEIQIRKPTKLNRNLKQQQPISSTTLASIRDLECSYTVYILTEDFQSDMNKPGIFIDLLIDETMSTDYMRLTTNETIREHLENNTLGRFKLNGKKIEKINTINLLIRAPDQITYWLPRYILIVIDDTQEIFQEYLLRFDNSKSLHYSNRDKFDAITIRLDIIPIELSQEIAEQLE